MHGIGITTPDILTQFIERPKRDASKVSNFRRYHLSGELDDIVQGKVCNMISRWEGANTERNSPTGHYNAHPTMAKVPDNQTPEQLRMQLEEQQAHNDKLQQQAETLKLRNQVEKGRMQQQQWEAAIQELQEAQEAMAAEHQKNLDRMRQVAAESVSQHKASALVWLEGQLGNPSGPTITEEARRAEEEKLRRLTELKQKKEDMERQIREIEGDPQGTKLTPPVGENPRSREEQELWLQQVRDALAPKQDQDQNKALLKALITAQNKTTGTGGTSTLRPEILTRLTEDKDFSMAKWLATLNKQDEGESLLFKDNEEGECRQECRHSKMRSGMLDKATTNIQRKEVWPQKNLGEDWAEEEMEFKQLRFEHLVAGETRTIETCTDPAQILRRLRLLKRIAYLKLWGIEWPLLRKMYAAILSSIETREYSWESNFDQFESILYRKILTETNKGGEREHKPEGRKRFCRDYNKEGCSKNSPHTIWFGSGPNAVKRTVYHYCAACLIRDRTPREHPEGHQDCPHRT